MKRGRERRREENKGWKNNGEKVGSQKMVRRKAGEEGRK